MSRSHPRGAGRRTGLLVLLTCVVPREARRLVVRRRACSLVAPAGPGSTPSADDRDVPGDELAVELVMVLVAAALRSGVTVSRALAVVAAQLPTNQAEPITRVCTALEWGASWSAATAHVTGPTVLLLEALAPAWESGASPDAALRLWSQRMRRDRQASAREAAGRLGVHLVVPLGACLLPAFVFLGLVPLVVSFGVGAG